MLVIAHPLSRQGNYGRDPAWLNGMVPGYVVGCLAQSGPFGRAGEWLIGRIGGYSSEWERRIDWRCESIHCTPANHWSSFEGMYGVLGRIRGGQKEWERDFGILGRGRISSGDLLNGSRILSAEHQGHVLQALQRHFAGYWRLVAETPGGRYPLEKIRISRERSSGTA